MIPARVRPFPSFAQFGCRLLLLGALTLGAALLGGCSTTKEVAIARESGTAGTARLYAVSTDRAWEIAKAVLREAGAVNLREDRAKGYMAGSPGADWSPVDNLLGAWVERFDRTNTRVTLFAEQRVPLPFNKPPTEAVLHERFAKALAQAQ